MLTPIRRHYSSASSWFNEEQPLADEHQPGQSLVYHCLGLGLTFHDNRWVQSAGCDIRARDVRLGGRGRKRGSSYLEPRHFKLCAGAQYEAWRDTQRSQPGGFVPGWHKTPLRA